ncbi:hypothetical protein J4E86_011162 [Alternaria arbusti]|uniref:uncharacterized protein n=1 Tax=Alternaria arbusti TaxID=232088 RepID=UPI00221F8D49|nr:uncharacterized protein J4E86_011162 [Alternaria arbusti]KAI4940196.1 hypothetical protein J4E86_011162 [Alternaria arbusti]
MTSASYEAIIWENELKKKIVSHARAVFIDQVRPGTVFDVVTTKIDLINEDQRYNGYVVHVIALDELSLTDKWQIVLCADRKSTEKEGLEELMRKLQTRLSDMIIPKPPVPVLEREV